jgi:hypothetical protein
MAIAIHFGCVDVPDAIFEGKTDGANKFLVFTLIRGLSASHFPCANAQTGDRKCVLKIDFGDIHFCII